MTHLRIYLSRGVQGFINAKSEIKTTGGWPWQSSIGSKNHSILARKTILVVCAAKGKRLQSRLDGEAIANYAIFPFRSYMVLLRLWLSFFLSWWCSWDHHLTDRVTSLCCGLNHADAAAAAAARCEWTGCRPGSLEFGQPKTKREEFIFFSIADIPTFNFIPLHFIFQLFDTILEVKPKLTT